MRLLKGGPIREGDSTSGGGVVVTASGTGFIIDGKALVLAGDKATCPKHGGIQTFVEGCLGNLDEGIGWVIEGCKLSCSCIAYSSCADTFMVEDCVAACAQALSPSGMEVGGWLGVAMAGLHSSMQAASNEDARMAQAAYGDPRFWTAQVGPPAPGTGTSPSGTPFVTGLGSEVDAIAARSPTLQAQLKQLDDKGWTFLYGTEAPSKTMYDPRRPHIAISPDLQSRPAMVVQQLVHEVGHALHPTQWDTSSRAAYVDSALRGEGWATLANVTAQQEILAAGGPDIGIASARPMRMGPQYQAIYQQYVVDGDANKAVGAIGQLYGQNEITGHGIPYADYYGNNYDDRFMH